MPEGPSIIILKEKAAHLKNKIVSEATGYAKLDMGALEHKKIIDLKTWGKHFLICFNDFTIRIHFGLFGSYQFDTPKKVNPKLALHFNDTSIYFYVCTVKRLDEPLDEIYDWERDIMSDQWDPAKALDSLQTKPTTMIGDALLDQNLFSGVGNIIKNEALYRSKVHPESQIGAIPTARLKTVIKEARDYSFDFLKWRKKGELSAHFNVYQQTNDEGSHPKVVRKETGTSKRISYFIPAIQKLYRIKKAH